MSRRTWQVVIADDNPEDRAEIRRLLLQGSEDRFVFREVAFGRQAVASVDYPELPPDCMILDYFLPDMEAPAILAALRDTGGLTRCPVVVLTGAASSALGHAVLRAGAQDFIGKDWLTAGGLVRAIENASERWLMARELERGARALAQREQALVREDQRKDEFLAVLAHELRNPLAALSTGLQILKAATPEASSARPIQEMMERQFRHMVRLVDDLLDVSRISNGKLELQRQCIAMQTVLEHAVEANEALMISAGHELIYDVDAQPILVDGDLTRLAQVVGNLLHNAIKYTPPGGRIVLGMQVETGEVVIRVSDNGAGIPSDMVAHVFDLFAQVDHTLKRAQGGLGIGLNVVAELVGMHGGSVSGHSDGLGLGSTFTVRLPSASSDVALALALPVASPAATVPAERPARVLVVDDNVDAADAIAMLLEMQDCDTRTVNDGLTAVAASLSYMPDMILLDIGLPDIDGFEVARRLRANPATRSVLLVAVTGWGSASDKLRSTAAGFDAHLTKPVRLETIMALLQVRMAAPA